MEILTTQEACALLRTKRLTLYKLVKSGEIPAFRMGRAWKFERTALEGWIRKRLEENNKLFPIGLQADQALPKVSKENQSMNEWTFRRANKEYKKYKSQVPTNEKVLSWSEWITQNVPCDEHGCYGEIDRWGHDLLNR